MNTPGTRQRVPPARAIIGCLLGTAVGDAVGLACEAMSKQRQAKMFPNLDGPRLLFGRGLVSDDTEHTCMVAQALIVSAGEPTKFSCSLAWRLRCWLLGLPPGIGLATLRSLLKLWVGFPPSHSGVYSAGNGPAMRSAILGVCYGSDPEKLRTLVRASSCITHTDPRAERGALAVALAAHCASLGITHPQTYCQKLEMMIGAEGRDLLELIAKSVSSAARGENTDELAAAMGLAKGVSGYVNHTVPIALNAWFRHPRDYRAAVLSVIHCGGDTDTMAAIAGAIVGSGTGKDGIPSPWLNSICEWPRTLEWIERLGAHLAEVCADGQARAPLRLPFYGVPLRNLFFATVVLAHGLRRLLPPY